MHSEQTTKRRIPHAVIRCLLESHGLCVARLSADEMAFWRFMDEVVDLAWRRQNLEVVR